MKKGPLISAGLLLYRRRGADVEVFLTHPGGPFFVQRDAGIWGIPKGLVNPGEDLLAAARREFEEETGFPVAGDFLPLQPIRQKGGKWVHAWAVEGDADPALLKSNMFPVQWPPRSGQWKHYPEIDRAGWFGPDEAREKILEAQWALVAELLERVGAA